MAVGLIFTIVFGVLLYLCVLFHSVVMLVLLVGFYTASLYVSYCAGRRDQQDYDKCYDYYTRFFGRKQ